MQAHAASVMRSVAVIGDRIGLAALVAAAGVPAAVPKHISTAPAVGYGALDVLTERPEAEIVDLFEQLIRAIEQGNLCREPSERVLVAYCLTVALLVFALKFST